MPTGYCEVNAVETFVPFGVSVDINEPISVSIGRSETRVENGEAQQPLIKEFLLEEAYVIGSVLEHSPVFERITQKLDRN